MNKNSVKIKTYMLTVESQNLKQLLERMTENGLESDMSGLSGGRGSVKWFGLVFSFMP
jgi:hypothetical protein